MHRTKPLPATCHGWRHSPSEGSAIEMKATRRHAAALAAIVTATASLLAGPSLAAGAASAGGFRAFTGPLHHVTTLASTVPGNGDINPYGMAVVPRSTGDLWRGNVLISNFNDKANVQGTGTTIVQVTPSGHVSQFALLSPQLAGCPGGVGLATALSVLRSVRVPDRRPHAGQLRLPGGRGRPVRPGRQAGPPRRLLRRRRHQHPGSAALTPAVALWSRRCGAGLERDPHQDGFGRQRHAERVPDPVPDLPCQRHQPGRARRPGVDQREGVLSGDPGAVTGVVSLAEPGPLDQPRGRHLHQAVPGVEPGHLDLRAVPGPGGRLY